MKKWSENVNMVVIQINKFTLKEKIFEIFFILQKKHMKNA
jgi:hypothetical protein